MRLWQNAFVALALSLVAGAALAAGDVGVLVQTLGGAPVVVRFDSLAVGPLD